MGFNEQINIYLTAIADTKGFDQMKKSIAAMQKAIPKATAPELTSGIGILQDRLKEITPQIAAYTQRIKESTTNRSTAQLENHKTALEREKVAINQTLPAMQKQLKAIEKQPSKLQKLSRVFKQMTGPMLGVMFAGMALQRIVFGLLTPAATAMGLFDIWSNTLTILFLPVMEMLLPVLLSVMDWVLNLDEGTKKAIGTFIVIAAVLGTFLAVIGMVGLAIGGILGLIVNVTELFQNLFGTVGGSAASFVVLTGGFEGIKSVVNKIASGIVGFFDTLLAKLGVENGINGLLGKVGIKLEDGETIWQALGRTANSVLDKMLEKLGFNKDESSNLGQNFTDLRTTIGNLNTKITEFSTTMEKAWGVVGPILTVFGQLLYLIWWLFDQINQSIKDLKGNGSIIGDLIEKIDILKKYTGASTLSAIGSAVFGGSKIDKVVDSYKEMERISKAVDTGKIIQGTLPSGLKLGGNIPNTAIPMSAGFAAKLAAAQQQQDFIWRPGSAPIAFSPNDTITGTKGGSNGGVVINQTNNIQVADKDELERLITRNNSRIVDDIKRISSGVAV